MKIVLRSLVRILEGIAIAAVLLVAVLGVQLARGPVPLTPVVPYVESALKRGVPDYTFTIADAELTWKRMSRRPELTVQNVQVRNANGEVIAAFGALDLRLDIPALIAGRVIVEHLGITRPVLRIVRAQDGSVRLGLEPATTATQPARPVVQKVPEGNAQQAPEAVVITPKNPEQSSRFVTDIIAGLRTNPDDPDSGTALENVEISQTTIVLIDEQSGVQWMVPDANFRLLAQRDGIDIAGNVPLVGSGTRISVDVAGRYTFDAGLLSMTASFKGLRPSAFAALWPDLAELKILDADLSGSIEANLVPDNLTSSAAWGKINIVAGAGKLMLPPEQGGEIAFSGAELKAATSGGFDQIAIEKFEIKVVRQDGLSPVISAVGKATNMRLAPDINVQATIDALTLQGLKDLWPQVLAPNTRNWIVDNLNHGNIKNVKATIDLAGQQPWQVLPEKLNLRADIAGVTVNYMKDMPKVQEAGGSLIVGLEEVTVKVDTGFVPDPVSNKGLRVNTANLRMYDLTKSVPRADFDIKIKGDLGDALRLIDAKPLQYTSKMGVDANGASGPADVDLGLDFPLLSNLSLDDLKINVKAKATSAHIDNVAFNLPLTDGDLEVTVINSGLALTGKAKLGGIETGIDWKEDFSGKSVRSEYVLDAVIANDARPLILLGFPPFMPPNIDGPVPAHVTYKVMRNNTATLDASGDLTPVGMAIPELGWKKERGTKANFTAALTLKNGLLDTLPAFHVWAENDLEVDGTATFGAGGSLKTLDIKKGRADRTNLALKLLREYDGRFVLDVNGPVFDAQYFWKELNKDESRGQKVEDLPPPEEAPHDQQPKDQTPVKISAKFGEMWLTKDVPLKDVDLYFERDKRAIQKIALKSKVEKSGAEFTFALGSQNGERTFSGYSDDGGGVVRSVGLFDDIKGGKLTITGKFTPQGAVDGEVNITEFKLVDAPMVARILSVAALTGIADELRGDGISFKTMRVPFGFAANTLRIGESEMFGSALGMTAQGVYRFSDSFIDVEGTVVPAYAINSALNRIPVIGTILTGPERGGGIFAANFTWRGPMATAEPSVNPLSVLTPGITRKIFSIFDAVGSSKARSSNATTPAATSTTPAQPAAKSTAKKATKPKENAAKPKAKAAPPKAEEPSSNPEAAAPPQQ
jgi:hypothetical protein